MMLNKQPSFLQFFFFENSFFPSDCYLDTQKFKFIAYESKERAHTHLQENFWTRKRNKKSRNKKRKTPNKNKINKTSYNTMSERKECGEFLSVFGFDFEKETTKTSKFLVVSILIGFK